MVRRVLISLTGLLLFGACRSVMKFAPVLKPGDVPDAAQEVWTIPDTGYVHVSKNGFRVFNLDSIVTDDDDKDSNIRWSLSPGPLLYVNLAGGRAEIGPVPNQSGASYVVFTATDPDGQSTVKTCPILVFDEFKVDTVPDTIVVSPNGRTNVAVAYQYRDSLTPGLKWDDPHVDGAWLGPCSLSVSLDSVKLTIRALGSAGTTGVSLTAGDSVNHVTFHYGIPVAIR